MSAAITPFDFDGQQVRAVASPDGKPLFVLADVCRVLDIANPSNVAARLDPDDLHSAEVIDSMGRTQRAHAVTESGVIDVTLDSRKPDARRFRRWLTHDVVPQIMQTGAYGAPTLSGPALMAAALIEAQATLEAQSAKIAVLEPKADYVDTFVASEDLRTLRHVANSLNMPEGELRSLLVSAGWIYAEQSSRWSSAKSQKVEVTRYSAYAAKRAYFRHVPVHDAPRFRGEVMHTLKVTPEGAVAIARLARRSGLQVAS